MQVSWIDEGSLRDLVGKLSEEDGQPPADRANKYQSWEIHTLPDPVAKEESGGDPLMDTAVPVAETGMEVPVTPPEPREENVSSVMIDQIRDRLRSVREKALGAGLLKPVDSAIPSQDEDGRDSGVPVTAVSEAVSEETPSETRSAEFEIPVGPVPARLDAYASWASQWLGDADLFLLDEEGHLLWGVQAKSGLVLSAMLAWSAARHASALSATDLPDVLHHPQSSGGSICIIPCSTRHGMIQVGIRRDNPVSDEDARCLRGALIAAINVGEA